MKFLPFLILLSLIPVVSAQVPSEAFEFTADEVGMLAPNAETKIGFSLTVGCQTILGSILGMDATVALADAPEWLRGDSVTLAFEPDACLGHDAVTQTGQLVLKNQDAPGLLLSNFKLVATAGSQTKTLDYQAMVDYVPGHTMTPAGDQIFTVTAPIFEFDMVIAIQANAKTMVMFEDKQVSGTASLSGLKANIFDVAAGDRNLTNAIKFTAPTGNWTEETVTFYTYSHCLEKEDCSENFAQNVTWTFVNDMEPVEVVPVVEETKDTPGFSLVGIVAILGAASILLRRNDS